MYTDQTTLIIMLLAAYSAAVRVNFVFVGIDDTAAFNYKVPGYITPATRNVTLETLRQAYPDLLSDMRVVELVANDTASVQEGSPCDFAVRSFPVLAEFYGQNMELFKPFDSDQITAVVAGEFCVDPNWDIASFAAAADIIFLSSTVILDLSNTAPYPTTLNLYPGPGINMFGALKGILTLHHWSVFGVICAQDDVMYYWDCQLGFQEYGFWDNRFAAGKAYRPTLTTHDIEERSEQILADMKQHARIIYIMTLPKFLRILMVAAYNLNMTNGDFVFIASERQPVYATPDVLHWEATDGDRSESHSDDQKAFEAFKYAMIIADIDVHWDNLVNFTRRSAELSAAMLNRTIPAGAQRDIVSVLFLEVVSVFLQGLQQLRSRLDDLTPSEFIKALLKYTYDLASRRLQFLPNGRTVLPTPILRFDISDGKFQVAAMYDSDNKSISIARSVLWAWPRDHGFPPDVPPCRFDGTSCKAVSMEIIAPVAALVVIGWVTFVVGWFIRKKADDKAFALLLLEDSQVHAVLSTGSLAVALDQSISKPVILSHKKFRIIVLSVLKLSHPNIATFYGINLPKGSEGLLLVWEFSIRGNLEQVCQTSTVFRDDTIRLTLLWDLLQGLLYIHTSSLQYHGAFGSDVCFISHRYSAKISKTGYDHLAECLPNHKGVKQFSAVHDKVVHCRADDVHKFGTISSRMLEPKGSSHSDAPKSKTYEKWQLLTQQCLQDDKTTRPNVKRVKLLFNQFRLPKNVVEYVLHLIEEQNEDLEILVMEKTKELIAERDKVDRVLAEILPRSVVIKLRTKESVTPEVFDSVSILFSDIPGFQTLLSVCSPWDVVSILNGVYTEFDRTFALFDAYKVETINDSYMVASGVPIRNGIQHAAVLCHLALRLLSSARICLASFGLTARIGINSGPVVAGVIGSKMPRYCLFGDTVNTASRMETNGEAGKIHVSNPAYRLAEHANSLDFVPRGMVEIKGKGEMTTFWLVSLDLSGTTTDSDHKN